MIWWNILEKPKSLILCEGIISCKKNYDLKLHNKITQTFLFAGSCLVNVLDFFTFFRKEIYVMNEINSLRQPTFISKIVFVSFFNVHFLSIYSLWNDYTLQGPR